MLEDVKSILVIQLRRIGDVIQTTPIVRSLRKSFPESRIDFLVEKPGAVALEGNPYIDNIIIYDKRRSLRMLFQVYRKRYDLVLDFLGNPRTSLLTMVSRARYRAGFAHRGRAYAYNIKVLPDSGPKYAVDFKYDLLKALGIKPDGIEYDFYIPEKSRDKIRRFFKSHIDPNRIAICISPTSRRKTRIWPAIYYARLSDLLIERYRAQIILLWGPGELQIVNRIASLMKRKPIIAPETNLKELAALIFNCNFMITNDNGPLHIGVSKKIPLIAIFGPTKPKSALPESNGNIAITSVCDCLGCERNVCTNMKCMLRLTPGVVEEHFRKWWTSKYGRRLKKVLF